MPTSPPALVCEVGASSDQLRNAFSLWPTAVEDDVREELTTSCPPAYDYQPGDEAPAG
jgi:hypothetical protein